MHWETNQLHSSVHEEWNIDAILFSMVNPFWGTAPNALLLLTSICVCVWWWPMVNRSCCWLVAVTLRLRMCQLFVCIGLTLHAKPSKPNRLLLALIHPTFLCSVRMVDIFAFHRSHADIWFIVDLELMWFCFGRKCFRFFGGANRRRLSSLYSATMQRTEQQQHYREWMAPARCILLHTSNGSHSFFVFEVLYWQSPIQSICVLFWPWGFMCSWLLLMCVCIDVVLMLSTKQNRWNITFGIDFR